MAKGISPAAATLLTNETGTEPVIIVGIFWGSGLTWYSSRPFLSYIPNIMSIGSVRTSKRNNSMCTTSSVSLTFSDTDGVMSTTLNGWNVEKAHAAVFMGFVGATNNDFVELIRGVTIGPAQWNEGDRTLSFEIESTVSSDELGFAPTADDFPDLAESAIGVPWPMIFGSCAHVPALLVREHTVGNLKFPIKLYKSPSYTITGDKTDIKLLPNPDVFTYIADPPSKAVIYVENGSKFPQDTEIFISITDVVFKGKFTGDVFTVTEANAPRFSNISFGSRVTEADNGDAAFNYRVAWLNDDKISLVNHHIYIHTASNKQWYNYVIKQIGKKLWLRFPTISPVTGAGVLISSTNNIDGAYTCSINGMAIDVDGILIKLKEKLGGRRFVPDRSNFGKIISAIDGMEQSSSAWFQATSDEEVRLWSQDDPDIYIASLIKLESIKAVFGKRKIKMLDGKTKDTFEQVPSNYYDIQLEANYPVAGNKPSGILFFKSLHDYAGQGWTGEIYVTGKSTIGPNSVDITKWILENYTPLTPDPSFGVVRTKVVNEEAHFAIFDKRDALKVAQEIAFQSRCGLILDSERIGIRFLAEAPIASMIITESNTELDSMIRTSTPTSEVTTRLIASWTETYRDKHPLNTAYQKKQSAVERALESMIPNNRRRKTETKYSVYDENITGYGLLPREENCYIYCLEANVQKFLNFWGHRFANSWQLIHIKMPLEASIFQIFDRCILAYTDGSLINSNSLPGEIQEVEINMSDFSVTLGIWIPRISGSIFIDSLAYPGE